jgi:hypothetical protein
MNPRVTEFLEDFHQVVHECQRFCYAARARECQVESIAALDTLDSRIAPLKAEMVEMQDEDAANCLLSLSLAARALSYELKMWIALKDDSAASAWDSLVEAQTHASNAIRAHRISDHLERYVERLDALERLLFPPITFMSIGMIIQESSCSICGSQYGDCDHVKGEVYMGEMCVREITQADLSEVSVVPEAANKHARVLTFSDGDAMRDVLTWRLIPPSEREEGATGP